MAVKSTGVIHSNAIGVYVSPSANTFNIIAYATSGSLELSRETIDATPKTTTAPRQSFSAAKVDTNVDGLVSPSFEQRRQHERKRGKRWIF